MHIVDAVTAGSHATGHRTRDPVCTGDLLRWGILAAAAVLLAVLVKLLTAQDAHAADFPLAPRGPVSVTATAPLPGVATGLSRGVPMLSALPQRVTVRAPSAGAVALAYATAGGQPGISLSFAGAAPAPGLWVATGTPPGTAAIRMGGLAGRVALSARSGFKARDASGPRAGVAGHRPPAGDPAGEPPFNGGTAGSSTASTGPGPHIPAGLPVLAAPPPPPPGMARPSAGAIRLSTVALAVPTPPG